MKKTILLQLLLGWTAIAAAQTSTICHDDGTVTFKYKNDQAKEVLLTSSMRHPVSFESKV